MPRASTGSPGCDPSVPLARSRAAHDEGFLPHAAGTLHRDQELAGTGYDVWIVAASRLELIT